MRKNMTIKVMKSWLAIRLLVAATLLATLTLVPSSAFAQAVQMCGDYTITFDNEGIPLAGANNTTVVSQQYATASNNPLNPLPPGAGLTLSGLGGTNQVVVYNSNVGTNGNDADLEGSNTGNAIIVQENTLFGAGTPDDVVGGELIFDFELPLSEFSGTFNLYLKA